MIKGIIFDFNGTLVFDDEINRCAWKKTFVEITGLNEEEYTEFRKKYKCVNNYPTLEAIFNYCNIPYTKENILEWSHHKEEKYHEIAISSSYQLVKGAEEFLNYIKEKNVPFNMATASIDFNVDFYFEQLNLSRWFNRDIVAYDDGVATTKKQIYLTAAKNINLDIKDCLVIEDSYAAMLQAKEAGVIKFIQMDKNKHNIDLKEVIQKVNDFSEIDKTIFE